MTTKKQLEAYIDKIISDKSKVDFPAEFKEGATMMLELLWESVERSEVYLDFNDIKSNLSEKVGGE